MSNKKQDVFYESVQRYFDQAAQHTGLPDGLLEDASRRFVIHVLDASRSVTVVSSLLGSNKEEFVEDIEEEYDEMREDYYAGLEDRNFLTFEDAQKAKKVIDFDATPPAPVPSNRLTTPSHSSKGQSVSFSSFML